MKAKHTPGPWRVVNKPRLSSLEVYAGDTAICELWRRADRAAEHATAQLIAAAPDLLNACWQALTHIESDECTHGRPFAAGNVLRAAIAKAEQGA